MRIVPLFLLERERERETERKRERERERERDRERERQRERGFKFGHAFHNGGFDYCENSFSLQAPKSDS